MRAIICGGGTVGHIAPAVAIADEILRNDKDAEILFIGRKGGDENNLIIRRGFNLVTINIAGLNRRNILKNFKAPFLLLTAYHKAKKIIKDFNPDIVIGTGGYVCLPVIKAATRLKIKSVLHESNAVMGLTARLLYKNCARLFLNIPINEPRLMNDEKTKVVGTPVLVDFRGISAQKARENLGIDKNDIFILSFGGSGGAEKLNECILGLSKENFKSKRRIYHIHATGRKYYTEELKRPLCNSNYTLTLLPYIDNMPEYMIGADIIISRAGAITIAELATTHSASILIPSPNVADNHQNKNANVLKDAEATIVINECDLTSERLKNEIIKLISSQAFTKKLKRNIAKFSSEGSANKIYREIKALISK